MNTFSTEEEQETVYVIHVCKNCRLDPKDPNYCDRAFIDEDLHNVQDYPSIRKYCPECEKKGFKNPKRRKKKK